VRTILITGFEPFGGENVNASWEAARGLEGWRCEGHVAAAVELPCVYDACVARLIEAFERLHPDAVLMTGQAARRGVVSVERIARKAIDATAEDNAGVVASGRRTGQGPDEYSAPARVGAIARAIREMGVAARVSSNAGGYVCNHLYYGALQYLRRASPKTPAVFLHLPATPGQSPPGANPRRLETHDAARVLKAAATVLLSDRELWRGAASAPQDVAPA
jgi:pyroglutamyl-peptidase